MIRSPVAALPNLGGIKDQEVRLALQSIANQIAMREETTRVPEQQFVTAQELSDLKRLFELGASKRTAATDDPPVSPPIDYSAEFDRRIAALEQRVAQLQAPSRQFLPVSIVLASPIIKSAFKEVWKYVLPAVPSGQKPFANLYVGAIIKSGGIDAVYVQMSLSTPTRVLRTSQSLGLTSEIGGTFIGVASNEVQTGPVTVRVAARSAIGDGTITAIDGYLGGM